MLIEIQEQKFKLFLLAKQACEIDGRARPDLVLGLWPSSRYHVQYQVPCLVVDPLCISRSSSNRFLVQ